MKKPLYVIVTLLSLLVSGSIFAQNPILESKAAQGDMKSQLLLGENYYYGDDGYAENEAEALKWFRKAAAQGSSDAKVYIGDMYAAGSVVEKNDYEAYGWYLQAAEKRNALGQARLGVMYYYGYGVSRNYEEAAKWLKKASLQNEDTAQCYLAYLYYEGKGVDKSLLNALEYFYKSAANGNEEARQNLDIINNSLIHIRYVYLKTGKLYGNEVTEYYVERGFDNEYFVTDGATFMIESDRYGNYDFKNCFNLVDKGNMIFMDHCDEVRIMELPEDVEWYLDDGYCLQKDFSILSIYHYHKKADIKYNCDVIFIYSGESTGKAPVYKPLPED